MLVKQNVGGFDIAMKHPFLMSIVNGSTDGGKKMKDISAGEKLPFVRRAFEIVVQGLPLDIFEDDVGDGHF